jgi:hypothetical protein
VWAVGPSSSERQRPSCLGDAATQVVYPPLQRERGILVIDVGDLKELRAEHTRISLASSEGGWARPARTFATTAEAEARSASTNADSASCGWQKEGSTVTGCCRLRLQLAMLSLGLVPQ